MPSITRLRREAAALVFVFAWLLAAPPALAESAATTPTALVNSFHSALLSVMKDAEALGYRGRFDRLAPHIRNTFHMRLMTQISSGSYWRKAGEAQKSALVDAFSKLSIGTYAARFDGFSGQSFETLETKAGPQNTRLVVTRLIDPSGTDVALTYVAKQVEGHWRIIDIVLDTGISELAVRRSEYRKILKQGGIEGLISTLNEKAAALRAG